MTDVHPAEIHIELLAPMRVARCRAVSAAPEHDAADRMARWRASHRLEESHRHFGFEIEVSAEEGATGSRGYEIWTTVPDGLVSAGEVMIDEVPGGRYAALTLCDPFVDPFATIPAGWERLRAWVVHSDEVGPAEGYGLEELVEHNGHQDLVLLYPVATVPVAATR
jgi:hypothetical protein